ncbi:ATP-binding cassette domain-containing protein [Oceanispirochaeta crateris]|uniref:ATP-binding cassette domain-containing protein n=1 Tax=Oceanispirochaeta crateris TaxID=2518645 RepID=A0A5C1QJB6_9SPIO|nr:oligopeptide/dipeptide ABC transporter ATP-binding protein [Oceanispirochaeta crateris]QEN08255.1 ATP-binding cassette domain-containing protein [Oceanispirochaeta crateris]
MSEPILQVKSLQKKFPIYGSMGRLGGAVAYVHAVNDVSFNLYEGQTYGLVGESGSGKTTVGRTILGLNGSDGGKVLYQGTNLMALDSKEFRLYRRDLQLVFQDPFSSLNPRKRVGSLLEEPLIIHKIGDVKERQEKVFAILETVGLQPEHYFRFPHEFSGGQRQRIGLARALIMNPKIVICDEPVSALDVSIQAQILNLLKRIQRELKLTMIFITHDISVVRHISNRIGVMYLGHIVEDALTDDLIATPRHPYTKALFSAIPDFSKGSNMKQRTILKGEIPSNTMKISGCPFSLRCPLATERCNVEQPLMREIAPQHFTACHFAE